MEVRVLSCAPKALAKITKRKFIHLKKIAFIHKNQIIGAFIGAYLLVLATGLFVFMVSFGQLLAVDERQNQYEQDIEEIQDRIDEVNISLDGLHVEQATLQETIANLDNQIIQIQSWINQTRARDKAFRWRNCFGRTRAPDSNLNFKPPHLFTL